MCFGSLSVSTELLVISCCNKSFTSNLTNAARFSALKVYTDIGTVERDGERGRERMIETTTKTNEEENKNLG